MDWKESAAAKQPVAIFDLDGTLTRSDTFLPFLASFAARRGRLAPLAVLPFVVGLYLLRVLKDRTAKGLLIWAFCKGRPILEIEAHAHWFLKAWVHNQIRSEIVAKLDRHRKAGLRTILLSASPDLYVPVIGAALGFDKVICTRVARDGECCSGWLDGTNCKGPQKIAAVQNLLGVQEAPGGSVAYGDSQSDLPLLRWVDRGYLVTGRRVVQCSLVDRENIGNPDQNA